MFTIIFFFLTILILSAVCSMAEAAILSLPLVRARLFAEEKRLNSKELLYVKENIAFTVASLVIINNTVNIIGSLFIGEQVALRYGHQWLGIMSVVMAVSIIILSEIIPKAIGERYKDLLSLFFAKPLRWLLFVFKPLVEIILRFTRNFTPEGKISKITEEEIRLLLKLARTEGTVEVDEEVLCNHVFKLNDVQAAQIMKPLDQANALPASKTLEELKEVIINFRFSRIIVYGKDSFDIVGVVQHRDLLREIAKDNYKAYVKEFMTKPVMVDARTKADTLLEKFQVHQQHLFIVCDTQKKPIGLVTMEDVLEELFGEIYDEKDVKKRT